MKKNVIYLLMAAIGTVGFTGCGPGQNTTQDRTGTYDSRTGTQMGTTQDRTVATTGNQTATTGTSGTRTPAATGTAGTTTNNTGQRGVNRDATAISNTQMRNNFQLNQPTDYSYNGENYRFTPDTRGINITRDVNGTQTSYGTMRTFGDEGYFMVTTTNASGEDEISVGKFDERGNFTIYRYDRNDDRIIEQNYRSNTPMNLNNR